ncbi:MAG: ABC transporter permease [Firmicutes bacterium]|nr:ABC transporter permease [Bacillota bacterium]MBR4074989.1 ABC transporter permease [Bacillota bacterium]
MKTKKKGSNLFLTIMGDEKRQSITIPLFAIFLSLIAGALLMLALGKNPIDGYVSLLRGCGLLMKKNYAGGKGMLTDFMSFLDIWTPMIFAALAVAVAYKAGLFNIGASGQMLMAGFIASITVGYSDLPAIVAKPAAILIGVVVGALCGSLIGFLKYKFNINEVVSAIMLNYIFQYVVGFFILTFYVHPVTRQSNVVSDASRLTLQNVQIGSMKSVIPLGFILAVIAVIVMYYFINHTRQGFELKAVGTNKKGAIYAGINANKNIMLAMVISGGLAGLAGVTYYMGYMASIQPKVLLSTGFDAVAVCLLGNSNPIGIVGSSFLVTIISKGAIYMNSSLGLPKEIASLITGLLLLFTACGVYIKYRLKKSKDRLEQEAKLAEAAAEGKEDDR